MAPAQAKRFAFNAGEAIVKLMQAEELFVPRDSIKASHGVLKERRRDVDQQIAAIIKQHKLKCTEAQLLSVVLDAAREYWGWWFVHHEQTQGLGDKENMRSFVAALTRVHQLLGDVKIRNRLKRVVKKTPPSDLPPSPSQGLRYVLGKCTFTSVKRSRAEISGLLKIAQLAEELDGRDDIAKRRDDLRSAARPLLSYWTDCEKQPGTLTNFGGTFSKCVLFIYDCLLLIDPDVTKQLIVDLER